MKVNIFPLEFGLSSDDAPGASDAFANKSRSVEAAKAPGINIGHGPNASKPAVRPIVNGLGMRLEFSIDKDTGMSVIKVLDAETGELVRQIPPEEVINLVRHFNEKGLLISRWL